jgi:glycosyltransferase involved in cell wall biosynthesis
MKLHEHTKIPCILHLHNDFFNPETKKAVKIANGYKRIVCVSDYISRRVTSISPEISRKCVTVYNAIDLQRFEHAKRVDRSCIPLSDDDFVIVYSGRLTEEKGILQLIQAIKVLCNAQSLKRIKLLIIGASAYGKDKQPTPFIEQLEKESEPIRDKVCFTGYINYEEVPSYLKMADIAVVPSMWEEPFGLTVLEAMAAGLPLITTRSGGIPEICEGVATIVGRDHVVDNLSAAILDLYEHPEKRRAMSEAARERARLFDKERYAREFFETL